MNNTAMVASNGNGVDIERVLIRGDLSALTPDQRVSYNAKVCESMGLNPLTRPFEYLKLNGREILYATRGCTDQLRKVHRVSLTIVSRERLDDVYVVTARATTPDGRTDESTGAVAIDKLRGEALANALMKAETKAKRRVTLSIVGLGMLDESEVESVPAATTVAYDVATGEVIEAPKPNAPPPKPALVKAAQAAPVAPAPAVSTDVLDAELSSIADAIESAANIAQLDAVKPRIVALINRRPKVPADLIASLKAAFSERKAALSNVAVAS